MKCWNCNARVKKNTVFCPKCGVHVIKSERVKNFEDKYIKTAEPEIVRSRAVSAIMALLFGDLGFHYFYNGQPLLGSLCIAFCWTGIPYLIALINCIQYVCCNSDAEFTKKYCTF